VVSIPMRGRRNIPARGNIVLIGIRALLMERERRAGVRVRPRIAPGNLSERSYMSSRRSAFGAILGWLDDLHPAVFVPPLARCYRQIFAAIFNFV